MGYKSSECQLNGGVGVSITVRMIRSRNLSGAQTCDDRPFPLDAKLRHPTDSRQHYRPTCLSQSDMSI